MKTEVPIEGEILKWGRCICGRCQKKGKMGNTTRPTKERPIATILCEDCTIKDISDKYKLSSKDAKKKHERSMKAQTQLAKIIMQRYEAESGKKIPKRLDGIREVLQPGMDWWHLLSDSDKTKVEDMDKDEQKAYFAKAPILPASQKPIVKEGPETGRNDPCPCGSGKKYKKCCLEKAAA